jgi:hypothetical protein
MVRPRFMPSAICAAAPLVLSLGLIACGGGGTTVPNPGGTGNLSLSLSTGTVVAAQDGAPGQIGVTLTGVSTANSVSVGTTGLPNGVNSTFTQSGSGSGGTLALKASTAVPAGTYSGNVVVTNGNQTASQSFVLVVAVVALVGSSADTTLGVNGKLEEFMSTSFQPSGGDAQFFTNHSATEPSRLSQLAPQHIRLQAVGQAIPMKADTGQSSDWDFTALDAVVQPILKVGDNSPEFQIAVAPSFLNDPSTGRFVFNTQNVQTFADYSANLVKYYNKGGFTWGTAGTKFASPNPQRHITWWGIFNEYNINGLNASQYVQLYNTVVPAMLAVDSTIEISALELALADPTMDLPIFVAPPTSGGVIAQVNVASTHFYPTCNPQDTDAMLFGRVPQFIQYIQYFYNELKMRSDLAAVPIWVTENNVNADFPNPDGSSNCNPAVKFVLDPRGTSAFFAAWRPYVFSQIGKAGVRALYHWVYAADTQYGEVDFNTDNTYLSYWLDQALNKLFPSAPSSPGPDILQLAVTESSSTEVLATKNADGSVVVMAVDRAVHSLADNNGSGEPRTVIVDVSALGTFSAATATTIDARMDPSSGPVPMSITPAPRLSVTLGGYGVTFLQLKP